ncbi:MAG: meso-butanediol dehydrogenase / (S,S)-butanediol dehydrogenase / diacetyl reductase, partial [Baekduia sp.]|nr:meso-butanediol dehydrogenase / (S,S)-butanediol dehydrogenase / diacetyl reductase [Baekduia sp.]
TLGDVVITGRSLLEKVALITGAESGMGAATARRYAAEGAQLVLVGLQATPLEAIADELGAVAVVGDAADPEVARAAAAIAQERFGGLDVVTTCAGQATFGASHRLLDTGTEAWAQGMRANLDTAAVTTREALPHLIERGGGTVVMIASLGALSSGPDSAVYTTAKTAILGLVRSVAVDYGPSNIRANAVCPGPTRSPMSDGIVGSYAGERGISRDDAYRELSETVPLRAPNESEEIASACLFLASSESRGITGTHLIVDNGQTALSQAAIPFLIRERPLGQV